MLPRNATGQAITSYVTWISGPTPCAAAPDGKKEFHIVFLDNGRLALARDPALAPVLRCVRCGACANVCPVYRLVGGHHFGHVYIGAVGAILTYVFHDKDRARSLSLNCMGCGACKEVCAAAIDLPGMIREVAERLRKERARPLSGLALSRVMTNRPLFHRLLRTARRAQAPVTEAGYVRHLPQALMGEQGFRALPALADQPFRDRFPRAGLGAGTGPRVALFAGCLGDFVYPEQLDAAVRLITARGGRVVFPREQSCCGLPLLMMSESEAARKLAEQNVAAFQENRADYVISLCASCASHLKNAYPKLLPGWPEVESFAGRVMDFSRFAREVLGIAPEEEEPTGKKVAYHAPCHLCRGLGVRAQPRALIKASGNTYLPTPDEEVCCGFGGSYSLHFPELSSRMLAAKLDRVIAAGADMLVTDCPGCVLQLRGGLTRRGSTIEVRHVAELLDKSE